MKNLGPTKGDTVGWHGSESAFFIGVDPGQPGGDHAVTTHAHRDKKGNIIIDKIDIVERPKNETNS